MAFLCSRTVGESFATHNYISSMTSFVFRLGLLPAISSLFCKLEPFYFSEPVRMYGPRTGEAYACICALGFWLCLNMMLIAFSALLFAAFYVQSKLGQLDAPNDGALSVCGSCAGV